MDQIIVTGNGPLDGEIPIAGAKNACLTLMPAALLSDEPLTLTNAPRLSDIRTMTALLQSLRAQVAALQGGRPPSREELERIDELTLETSGGFWHAEGYELPW